MIASVAQEGHEARHDAVVGRSPVGQVIATCADVVPMSIALPMAEAGRTARKQAIIAAYGTKYPLITLHHAVTQDGVTRVPNLGIRGGLK